MHCWNESGGDGVGSEWPSLQREIAGSLDQEEQQKEDVSFA